MIGEKSTNFDTSDNDKNLSLQNYFVKCCPVWYKISISYLVGMETKFWKKITWRIQFQQQNIICHTNLKCIQSEETNDKMVTIGGNQRQNVSNILNITKQIYSQLRSSILGQMFMFMVSLIFNANNISNIIFSVILPQL